MIDVHSERTKTLTKAANSLPDRPNVSTLHRWRTRGIKGIRLETILIGGVRYTSDEALQRFFERVTAAADGDQVPTMNSRQQQRADDEADRVLDEAGV